MGHGTEGKMVGHQARGEPGDGCGSGDDCGSDGVAVMVVVVMVVVVMVVVVGNVLVIC